MLPSYYCLWFCIVLQFTFFTTWQLSFGPGSYLCLVPALPTACLPAIPALCILLPVPSCHHGYFSLPLFPACVLITLWLCAFLFSPACLLLLVVPTPLPSSTEQDRSILLFHSGILPLCLPVLHLTLPFRHGSCLRPDFLLLPLLLHACCLALLHCLLPMPFPGS